MSHSLTAIEVLQKYWGYNVFRPMQAEIVSSVLEKKDTLALLPTGGGKSICFQVPGLVLGDITVVVSPLIALMKDQVMQLNKRGIKAAALDSTLNFQQIVQILDEAQNDKSFRFLYLSPERLNTRLLKDRLQQLKVKLIAVDEAHCISQWGYDFRPEYLEIAQIRTIFPNIPIIALTATATPEVANDIVLNLQFKKDHNRFQKSFVRENIGYVVHYTENKPRKMLEIAQKMKGTGIIYVNSRKETEGITKTLTKAGITAGYYHAGLNNIERAKKQEDWIQNKLRVIVCTNAFGMGIDKPDVRWVLHISPPQNIESYFQEAGRAGRDGNTAWAVMLYNNADDQVLWQNHEFNFPTIQVIKRVYAALGLHFQLAKGAQPETQLPFEIGLFAQKYQLQVGTVFNAIKILHRAGYLSLQETSHNQPLLRFLVNYNDLYKFQISNQRFDAILQILPRMYGGLFDGLVAINEQQIALKLGTKKEFVENQLRSLEHLQIIVYQPLIDKPSIYFLQPMQNAEQLFFAPEAYSLLKERAANRIESINKYTATKTICRSVQLVAYFGENIDFECGKCDVCRGVHITTLTDNKYAELIARVVLLLPINLKDLNQKLKLPEILFKEFTRKLIDEGFAKLVENTDSLVKP